MKTEREIKLAMVALSVVSEAYRMEGDMEIASSTANLVKILDWVLDGDHTAATDKMIDSAKKLAAYHDPRRN